MRPTKLKHLARPVPAAKHGEPIEAFILRWVDHWNKEFSGLVSMCPDQQTPKKQKLVFIDAGMILNMEEKYTDKVGDGWRIIQMMSVNKGFGSNDVVCLLCEEE